MCIHTGDMARCPAEASVVEHGDCVRRQTCVAPPSQHSSDPPATWRNPSDEPDHATKLPAGSKAHIALRLSKQAKDALTENRTDSSFSRISTEFPRITRLDIFSGMKQ